MLESALVGKVLLLLLMMMRLVLHLGIVVCSTARRRRRHAPGPRRDGRAVAPEVRPAGVQHIGLVDEARGSGVALRAVVVDQGAQHRDGGGDDAHCGFGCAEDREPEAKDEI